MDIKKEFININISKKNSEIVLLLCIAVLSEIIFDREGYYSKNLELKEFTVKVLEKDYREYIFNARPALFARIVKDLRQSHNKNIVQFLKIAKNIQVFLKKNIIYKSDNEEKQQKKVNKNNKNIDVIDAWRKVIES
ncbi:hypothetical protein [Ureibacillus thermosphaericus]|uniref:Uncharacterized protein n=1 Tax=Ureibacillus thermosphaericus TaxID=51173 RepID=A0A840PVV4_URETH|nr:hypothetical protein [Ureibacillus thermosphaericus]MBB5150569.1 hypothetical protein [Ureibacillus thermosphaericus]NKZ33160.1 hypothetical protein [Ureibacillus thermosphaericus]